MFKKIVEFIHSFKVKPVATPAAPYKLEPPESTVAEVPVKVESLPVETTVVADTIKFPKAVEPEVIEGDPIKKPVSKRKSKALDIESDTDAEIKTAPAMKVVKTKTPRKPKSTDL